MSDDDEGFLDFSVATPFERLVAKLTTSIQALLLKERSSYLVIDHALPFRRDNYILSLIRGDPASAPLQDRASKLQDWFQVDSHLTLVPDSHSGRILDQEEASTLLSAGAIAGSNAACPLPLFVPVQDALRDGALGVDPGGAAHYESDSLHTSALPSALFYPGEQLRLFAARLDARDAPAAQSCRDAAEAGRDDEDGDGDGVGAPHGCDLLPRVSLQARASFPLASPPSHDPAPAARPQLGAVLAAFFRPPRLPVRLDLDLVWRYADAGRAVAAATGRFDPASAAEWHLAALDPGTERDDGHRGFVLQAVDRRRRYLRLAGVGAEPSGMHDASPRSSAGSEGTPLSGALAALASEAGAAAQAPSMGHLASADWWAARGARPPPCPAPDADFYALLGEVLARDGGPRVDGGGGAAAAAPRYVGKAAPPDSLLGRFSLAALHLRGARRVATAWNALLRTLRFEYLEHGVGGPGGGGASREGGPVDLGAALPHQHLQLFQLSVAMLRDAEDGPACLARRASDGSETSASSLFMSAGEEGVADGDLGGVGPLDAGMADTEVAEGGGASGGDEGAGSLDRGWEDDGLEDGSPAKSGSAERDDPPVLQTRAHGSGSAAGRALERPGSDEASHTLAAVPQGVASILPGAYLLHHPDVPLAVPETQAAPPCTEEALLGAGPSSGQGEDGGGVRASHAALLASDMAAFKAANPAGACLADFVRWHSPKDWRPGGSLSARMAAPGNAWAAAWQGARACPAARQRPLHQPRREAERALHALETVLPEHFWRALLAVARSTALAVLQASEVAGMAPVAGQLERLRRQMEAADPDDFPAEDFRRVETLIATASSMLCTLGSLPQGLGAEAGPAGRRGAGRVAWDLTARALERALGDGAGRASDPGAARHAAAVPVQPGEREFLAACMSGGAADDAAAWPSAHRTEWLLCIGGGGGAQHRLHVESLAAELRVSSVLLARGARRGSEQHRGVEH
ncbi:hypothetical protein ACKKBG_A04685 [Auxenochlorella protothecoides x Auxenochlorella symbiontica]